MFSIVYRTQIEAGLNLKALCCYWAALAIGWEKMIKNRFFLNCLCLIWKESFYISELIRIGAIIWDAIYSKKLCIKIGFGNLLMKYSFFLRILTILDEFGIFSR